MRSLLVLLISAASGSTWAQASDCDLRREPHSYACMVWNFEGNEAFPLFEIDWFGVLQGEWVAVTYANSESQNNGSEFYMAKNPRRPSQPLGIFNVSTKSPVGKMWIHHDQWTIENWRGQTVTSTPQSLLLSGSKTVQLQMSTFENGREYHHAFNCRDFNRKDTHHLLCKWMMWFPEDKVWLEKGFLGFLPAAAWDAFSKRN